MATITQTKLVGFCLGDKSNYSATAYANHIWFDPTNKQILLNGIEYIPKKLSELVNDKNFLTSITKAMVEGVLTGNITSHTHTFASLTSKPTTLEGYGITDAMRFTNSTDYVAARFNDTSLATKAANYYIEFWQSGAGWFNLQAGKFITAGGTSSQFLKGDGSLDGNTYALSSALGNYLPLTGGTLTGALTCNGYHIDMNNDSGSRGYRGFFNQSNNTSRASGSHIFMKGGGEALGTNSVSIGYQAYAGIRNKDSDATTYPYIAWQWMPTEKFMVNTTNSATLSGGEYYGFPLLPNEMVRWNIDGGQNVIYENSSASLELLVVIKASDADTGLVFGGKTTLPYRASKTLIAGKYIVGSGEYLKNITEITINNVKYYQVIIYTWNTTAFPTSYDFTQQVKVMCATKVSNSNYSGESSYASGAYSVASGNSSVASGFYSVASGFYSVASGYSSVASSEYSVASGYSSVSSGYYSVASGYYSVASGHYSVASGFSSVASGYYSVASGAYSVASGNYSVASGAYSVASGDFSVVLARNGETMSSYQTIVGRFNAKVAGLFIIGNGTSDTARSNAFVVDDSGNVTAKYFSGYANAIGGEGFKIYAENNNQINFGGTASDTTIVFGAASKDNRNVPTTYKFGANGTATIQAASFSGNAATASSLNDTLLTDSDTLNSYIDGRFSYINAIDPAGAYSTNAVVLSFANRGYDVFQLAMAYNAMDKCLAFRRLGISSGSVVENTDWNPILTAANYNFYSPTLKGAGASGTWGINITGNAATATALTSSAGSATQPIYFSNGKPVACSYTLGKSVPSNAVFTDTTYSVATASADGLMSAAMYKAYMVKSVGVRQGDTAVIEGGSITNHSVYITQKKSNITNVYQQAVGENDVKIPNATKDYDGSMSYTDKRKLDNVHNNCVAASVYVLNLSYNFTDLNGLTLKMTNFLGLSAAIASGNRPDMIRLVTNSTTHIFTLYDSTNVIDDGSFFYYRCDGKNAEISIEDNEISFSVN